jgi:hypothetical protein
VGVWIIVPHDVLACHDRCMPPGPEPGLTRDVVTIDMEHDGRTFRLIDTAGYVGQTKVGRGGKGAYEHMLAQRRQCYVLLKRSHADHLTALASRFHPGAPGIRTLMACKSIARPLEQAAPVPYATMAHVCLQVSSYDDVGGEVADMARNAGLRALAGAQVVVLVTDAAVAVDQEKVCPTGTLTLRTEPCGLTTMQDDHSSMGCQQACGMASSRTNHAPLLCVCLDFIDSTPVQPVVTSKHAMPCCSSGTLITRAGPAGPSRV